MSLTIKNIKNETQDGSISFYQSDEATGFAAAETKSTKRLNWTLPSSKDTNFYINAYGEGATQATYYVWYTKSTTLNGYATLKYESTSGADQPIQSGNRFKIPFNKTVSLSFKNTSNGGTIVVGVVDIQPG